MLWMLLFLQMVEIDKQTWFFIQDEVLHLINTLKFAKHNTYNS